MGYAHNSTVWANELSRPLHNKVKYLQTKKTEKQDELRE